MLLVFLPLLLLLRLLLLLVHAEAQNGAVGAKGQSTGAQKGAADAEEQPADGVGAPQVVVCEEEEEFAGAGEQSAAAQEVGAEEQVVEFSCYHDYDDGEQLLVLRGSYHGTST